MKSKTDTLADFRILIENRGEVARGLKVGLQLLTLLPTQWYWSDLKGMTTYLSKEFNVTSSYLVNSYRLARLTDWGIISTEEVHLFPTASLFVLTPFFTEKNKSALLDLLQKHPIEDLRKVVKSYPSLGSFNNAQISHMLSSSLSEDIIKSRSKNRKAIHVSMDSVTEHMYDKAKSLTQELYSTKTSLEFLQIVLKFYLSNHRDSTKINTQAVDTGSDEAVADLLREIPPSRLKIILDKI